VTPPATSAPAGQTRGNLLPGMPAPLAAGDVYAADRPGDLSPVARQARPLVYVPPHQEQRPLGDRPDDVQGDPPDPERGPRGAARGAGVRPARAVRGRRQLRLAAGDTIRAPGSPAAPSTSPTRTTCTSLRTAGTRSSSPNGLHRLDFYDPHSWRPGPPAAGARLHPGSTTSTTPPTADCCWPAASSPGGWRSSTSPGSATCARSR